MKDTVSKQIESLTLKSKLALINANSYYGINPTITKERKKFMEEKIREFHKLRGEIDELCKESKTRDRVSS